MTSIRFLIPLFLALAGTVHGASQMWEWTVDDGSGPKRHITDMPPPANLKNVKILRSPKGAAVAATTPAPTGPVAVPALAASGAAGQAVPGNLPTVPAEDKDLVARKKQAEAAVAAKQREEAQAQARIRADNCTRSQAAKAAFDSGQRISTTQPNGERVILDDAARAAELRRVQASISSNCGG